MNKGVVCRESTYKGKIKTPCNKKTCIFHISNIITNQKGVEVTIRKREELYCVRGH